IQTRLAGRSVRVETEMGGKNAAVILDDADLDLAVPTVAAGAFGQAGQRCTSTSRLIVQKGVAADVRARLAALIEELHVAPGSVDGADLGPAVDESAQQEIREHVTRAVHEGAEVLAQRDLHGAAAEAGAFVEPTLLNVSTNHSIWRDEVFGPVLGMLEVDTVEEAIAAVNDSDYGLASAVFTGSLASTGRFIENVDTGQVAVNQPTTG